MFSEASFLKLFINYYINYCDNEKVNVDVSVTANLHFAFTYRIGYVSVLGNVALSHEVLYQRK